MLELARTLFSILLSVMFTYHSYHAMGIVVIGYAMAIWGQISITPMDQLQ